MSTCSRRPGTGGVAVLCMRHKPCQLAWKALETGEAAGSTTWHLVSYFFHHTARLSLTRTVLLYGDRQLGIKVKYMSRWCTPVTKALFRQQQSWRWMPLQSCRLT